MDVRITAYARLLVERSIDVQPGWQVLVQSYPPAHELVDEIQRWIARRGAYALVRYNTTFPPEVPWTQEAPEELVGTLAPLEAQVFEGIDAWIHVHAPENLKAEADLTEARSTLAAKARAPFTNRRISFSMPWVGCEFPVPALAQEAGMSLRSFEDFLYGACLIDWDAEGERMQRIADRFDRAEEVRIVAAETDLRLSLAGRIGMVDDGHFNMPGGEVFYSPVEDSAEGVITFGEFPAVSGGRFVEGARFLYKAGLVVEASARAEEDFLLSRLASDEGARRLGELGIGCNPGITRHMRNTRFDEKIDGTIHLAIGAGLPLIGGKNVSSVHWDMVKDLRPGGRLYCDGELVQESGVWKI
jgi:aminopeptidase